MRIWYELDLLNLYKTPQSVSRSGSFCAFSANILIQLLKSSPDVLSRKVNYDLFLQLKFCFTLQKKSELINGSSLDGQNELISCMLTPSKQK